MCLVINTAAIKKFKDCKCTNSTITYESIANGNWETVTTWKNNAVQDTI
jgi:hypothetical protein